MLYYIVPPIIMVLSLSFLIFFLFRKFSIQEEKGVELLEKEKAVGDNAKKQSLLSRAWLKFLEKTTQRLKLFSLKMHNASNQWFHSIKMKRESMGTNNGNEEDVSGKINRFEEDDAVRTKLKMENFSIKEEIVRKGPIRRGIIRKKENRTVKNGPGEKNRLEEALIKRIAVNPKDIEAYERLGDYYSDTKNLQDAAECYRQVAKLSPRHFKAKSKLRSLERILKM